MGFFKRFWVVVASSAVLAGCGGGGDGAGGGPVSLSGFSGGGMVQEAPQEPGVMETHSVEEGGSNAGIAKVADPDETGFDVFLLAGQSNMVGWNSDRDPALDTPDPRIFQLGSAGTHKNNLIPATDPLEHPSGNRGVGPAMRFSKAYLDSLPSGRRVLLVPSAVGATGFSDNRWNPGNDLFEQAVARANIAMAVNPNNRFVAILWHQGETDVPAWGRTPLVYQAALDKAIYTFRARITGAASAPMVLGKFTDGWAAVDTDARYTKLGKAGITAAIDDTPRRVPFTAVAQSTGLAYARDVIHFNAAGQRELGLRYFAQLPNAQAHALAAFALPSAPGTLNASSGATWIKLDWAAPLVSQGNTINGYRVAYRLAGDATWTDRYVASANTSVYLAGLTPGANYAVRVAAVGQAGLGAAAQMDSVVTASPSAVVVPRAPFEYTFEAGSLVNTGSLGTSMNGTAVGAGVDVVTDATRGKVMNLQRGGWVSVPRAINGAAYTKSVWVKFATYGGYQNLVSSANTGRTEAGKHAFFMQPNQIVTTGGHGGSVSLAPDSMGIPALGTWYNFVTSYDSAVLGGVLRLYRNGVKVAEKTGVPPLHDQANFFSIGAYGNGNTLNGGFLDNVRIYDVALDDFAISDIYAKEVAR